MSQQPSNADSRPSDPSVVDTMKGISYFCRNCACFGNCPVACKEFKEFMKHPCKDCAHYCIEQECICPYGIK